MTERSVYEKTATPTIALLRWNIDADVWEAFSLGNSDEELKGPIAHSAGKGWEGPWVLLRSGSASRRFETTDDLFEFLRA